MSMWFAENLGVLNEKRCNLYYSMIMLTCYTTHVIRHMLYNIRRLFLPLRYRRSSLTAVASFLRLYHRVRLVFQYLPPICYVYRRSLKITLPYIISYSIGGGKSVI